MTEILLRCHQNSCRYPLTKVVESIYGLAGFVTMKNMMSHLQRNPPIPSLKFTHHLDVCINLCGNWWITCEIIRDINVATDGALIHPTAHLLIRIIGRLYMLRDVNLQTSVSRHMVLKEL
jgi:hypothetical protein